MEKRILTARREYQGYRGADTGGLDGVDVDIQMPRPVFLGGTEQRLCVACLLWCQEHTTTRTNINSQSMAFCTGYGSRNATLPSKADQNPRHVPM